MRLPRIPIGCQVGAAFQREQGIVGREAQVIPPGLSVRCIERLRQTPGRRERLERQGHLPGAAGDGLPGAALDPARRHPAEAGAATGAGNGAHPRLRMVWRGAHRGARRQPKGGRLRASPDGVRFNARFLDVLSCQEWDRGEGRTSSSRGAGRHAAASAVKAAASVSAGVRPPRASENWHTAPCDWGRGPLDRPRSARVDSSGQGVVRRGGGPASACSRRAPCTDTPSRRRAVRPRCRSEYGPLGGVPRTASAARARASWCAAAAGGRCRGRGAGGWMAHDGGGGRGRARSGCAWPHTAGCAGRGRRAPRARASPGAAGGPRSVARAPSRPPPAGGFSTSGPSSGPARSAWPQA